MPDLARAHADLLARLVASQPPRIALHPEPEHFSACARHVEHVIGACQGYLHALVDCAGENEQGSLIADADLIGSIEAHLSDLAGETAGTLDRVAEQMISERYGSAGARRHFNRRLATRG